jgi:hypothetical protein
MGSQPLSSAPLPQQAVPPLAARFAASPYFCFTTSWMFVSLIESLLYWMDFGNWGAAVLRPHK